MTLLGIFFIPTALICFLWRPGYLLPLLIVAMPFEAGSVFNGSIGDFDFGLPPFYFVEICITLRLAVCAMKRRRLFPPQGDPARHIAILLFVFGIWSVLSAFVMPHLFAGVMVESPRASGADLFVPLQWNLSNLAQAMYLTLNVGAMLYALQMIQTQQSSEQLLKAFYWAAFIAVAVGLAQSFALAVNWEFPYEMFNNNPGYIQGFEQEIENVRRINSTFVEPSFAGSFLGAVATGLLASFLSGRRGLRWFLAILMVVIVLLQTTATTGLAAFAVMLCVMLAFFNPFKKQDKTTHSLAKTWVALGVVFCILALMLYLNPDLLEAATAVTIEKLDSISFSGRLISDLFALTVFANTGTLGSGLGSSRSSSLLTTLLSTVGIVGTGLFAAVLYRIIKMFPGKMAPASLQMSFWALLGLLVAHVIAIPDLNRPALWALIMLVLVQLNVCANHVSESQMTREFTNSASVSMDGGALPAS